MPSRQRVASMEVEDGEDYSDSHGAVNLVEAWQPLCYRREGYDAGDGERAVAKRKRAGAGVVLGKGLEEATRRWWPYFSISLCVYILWPTQPTKKRWR